MNIAPAGVRDRCSICAATDTLIARSVLIKRPEDLREEIRSQLLIAFIFGVRRHILHICAECKRRLEQAAHVVPGGQA
jgi:hypothetical protein